MELPISTSRRKTGERQLNWIWPVLVWQAFYYSAEEPSVHVRTWVITSIQEMEIFCWWWWRSGGGWKRKERILWQDGLRIGLRKGEMKRAIRMQMAIWICREDDERQAGCWDGGKRDINRKGPRQEMSAWADQERDRVKRYERIIESEAGVTGRGWRVNVISYLWYLSFMAL